MRLSAGPERHQGKCGQPELIEQIQGREPVKPRRQRQMAINYRTRFAYRIDMWDAEGENIIEHLAGVEDLQFAKATYLAACKRWPGAPITLSEGMHVIEDNRRKRLV
jgi:hypothetical protein